LFLNIETEKSSKWFSAKIIFAKNNLQSQIFLQKNKNKSIMVRVCFFVKKAEK